MCWSRREDSFNHNNLRVSRNCSFGHWMEPSRLSSEAPRDSRSTAKSNASIVPFTTQRFFLSYRILCFELETDGSFRWSTQPHSPCFIHPISLTLPTYYVCVICVCVCVYIYMWVCVCVCDLVNETLCTIRMSIWFWFPAFNSQFNGFGLVACSV